MARFTCLDGAIGTRLRRLGYPAEGPTAPANHSAPDLVRRVHREYVRAGAEIVTTNTFTLPDDADSEALIVRGIELARETAAERNEVRVALSVGPLAPRPAATERTTPLATVLPYLRAMERVPPDLVLLETQVDTEDAILLSRLFREQRRVPVWTGLTLREDGRTWDDLAWPVAARRIEAAGATPGISCTSPAAARRATEAGRASVPAWAKLNAGVPHASGEHPVSVAEFLATASDLANAGWQALGGCCGTEPDWIRALASTIST